MLRIISFSLLVLLLAACGRSQPTAYYAFKAEGHAVSATQLPKTTLRIARVAIPQYLERDSVILREPNSVAITVDSLNVWAEPLGDGIRRSVHTVLLEPLLEQGITVLPLSTEANGTYALFIDVLRLEGTKNGTAHLTAQWSLVANDNTKIVCDGIYSDEKEVQAGTYAGLVEAEGELVTGCARQILENITARLASSARRK